jgi:hypothetical protein
MKHDSSGLGAIWSGRHIDILNLRHYAGDDYRQPRLTYGDLAIGPYPSCMLVSSRPML